MEQRIGIASSLDRSITQAIGAEALAAILDSASTISVLAAQGRDGAGRWP